MPKRGGKFPIEHGGPLPQRRRPIKYPLEGLEIGQSFLVPAASIEELRKVRARVANSIQAFEKQTCGQRKFTLQTTSDDVRVWRVA